MLVWVRWVLGRDFCIIFALFFWAGIVRILHSCPIAVFDDLLVAIGTIVRTVFGALVVFSFVCGLAKLLVRLS